ncbi:MAG TPA: CbiQ family ECF transporter T component [Polyangia bacterium]|nr:CbiQ family ECF transporter T component [Polyangia bacterium]
MRTSLHDIWGRGRGPVRRLSPHTRLNAGIAAFAACIIAPAATVAGSLGVAAVVAIWLAACRPPFRVLRIAGALGLVLFLPYFLLLPLLPDAPSDPGGSWRQALLVPWAVLLHGMSGMLVSVATVASLSASELREALVRLPVPGVVSAILLQIVHQAATLFYETKRVAAAMAVRGASSGGVAGWRVLSSLPRVWLPRVVERAERVTAAMELRGYGEDELRSFQRSKTGLADCAALVAAAGALAASIALRLWCVA